jgi:hypothetical protein
VRGRIYAAWRGGTRSGFAAARRSGVAVAWPSRVAIRLTLASAPMSLVKTFVSTFMPAILKPLRVLWNEIIGFFFLVFGIIFGFSLWRRFQSFHGGPSELLGIAFAAIFVAMLLGYGLFSFLRARKISRS